MSQPAECEVSHSREPLARRIKGMKSYVISLNDAGTNERRATVVIPDRSALSKAVENVVQSFVSTSGDELCFPIFIDIHPAAQFEHVAWMHGNRLPSAPFAAN